MKFKINLRLPVSYKILWPSVSILLIFCVVLYTVKEKEKTLRITAEGQLHKTIEEKKTVENNLAEAKKEILTKDEQIKLTLDKLEREITARKETEVQWITVVKERQILEAKVEELTAALPKNIALEKIIIKNTRDLTGKVLFFDKENTFVMLNLGVENNLKLGDILSVYRDDKFIGKVQIEKLEEKTSAAVNLALWKNVEFKENDVVRKL